MDRTKILKEFIFKTSRSSGAGGQHVNKVSTKVDVSLHIENSEGLSERDKKLLLKNLYNRITKDGFLQLSSSETRSQYRNKEIAIQRFFELLNEKLKRSKVRRVTKPTRGSLIRKAEKKQKHSLKKTLRKKPKID